MAQEARRSALRSHRRRLRQRARAPQERRSDPGTLAHLGGGRPAVSLTARLGLRTVRQGRVAVAPTLEVPEHPDIYVIGDAAYLEVNGAPLPMMAPVAIQMAGTAAANIRRRLAGQPPAPFDYRDPGSLATIGRNAAVAYIHGIGFTGF